MNGCGKLLRSKLPAASSFRFDAHIQHQILTVVNILTPTGIAKGHILKDLDCVCECLDVSYVKTQPHAMFPGTFSQALTKPFSTWKWTRCASQRPFPLSPCQVSTSQWQMRTGIRSYSFLVFYSYNSFRVKQKWLIIGLSHTHCVNRETYPDYLNYSKH